MLTGGRSPTLYPLFLYLILIHFFPLFPGCCEMNSSAPSHRDALLHHWPRKDRASGGQLNALLLSQNKQSFS